jgi:hypothetical protein
MSYRGFAPFPEMRADSWASLDMGIGPFMKLARNYFHLCRMAFMS